MRGVALALLLAVTGCNSLLGIDDLTLVDAVSIDAQATYVFREGVGGYASTQDTFITSLGPTTQHGDDVDLQWSTTGSVHTLLRFDDLFGSGGIPPNATIRSATLQLAVVEAQPMNGTLYELELDWNETDTYDTFAPPPPITSAERGRQIGVFDASALGVATINVTTGLQRWSAAPTTNRGWLLAPADPGTIRVGSSEDPVETQRPQLTVEIVPQ